MKKLNLMFSALHFLAVVVGLVLFTLNITNVIAVNSVELTCLWVLTHFGLALSGHHYNKYKVGYPKSKKVKQVEEKTRTLKEEIKLINKSDVASINKVASLKMLKETFTSKKDSKKINLQIIKYL